MLNGTLEPLADSRRENAFGGQGKAGWRRVFLRALRRTGLYGASARIAGVHPSWVSRTKQRNPRFARACQRASSLAVRDKVEAVAETFHELATVGELRETVDRQGNVVARSYRKNVKAGELWLKAHAPGKWDRRPTASQGGNTLIVNVDARNALLQGSNELVDAVCKVASLMARPNGPTSELPSGQAALPGPDSA